MSHLNNSIRYYDTNEGNIVLKELHKLWKHHTIHLREMYQRNTQEDVPSCKNNPKFQVGQPVMFRNHAHHTFELKYLPDYQVLQIPNDNILILVPSDDKERKININDVKQCSTSKLVENAWHLFWGFIENNHQKCTYNLRPGH